MFGEINLAISLTSIILSVAALLRSGRTGVPGPAGPQGPAGKDGSSSVARVTSLAAVPAAARALDPAHAECVSCHRVVARYNAQGVCLNCAPLK